MHTLRSFRLSLAVAAALLLCSASFAQTDEANKIPQPQYKSVVLDGDQKLELDFDLAVLGSVTIQVVSKAPAAAEPKGIAGFKVRLRSKDLGFERWYLDQLTDAHGSYTFECLRPGKYTIELDLAGLKAQDTSR